MVDMNKIKKILIIIGIIVLAIISIPILIFFLPAIIGIMLLLVFTAWIWVPIVCVILLIIYGKIIWEKILLLWGTSLIPVVIIVGLLIGVIVPALIIDKIKKKPPTDTEDGSGSGPRYSGPELSSLSSRSGTQAGARRSVSEAL
jgi:amino acid transporter